MKIVAINGSPRKGGNKGKKPFGNNSGKLCQRVPKLDPLRKMPAKSSAALKIGAKGGLPSVKGRGEGADYFRQPFKKRRSLPAQPAYKGV